MKKIIIYTFLFLTIQIYSQQPANNIMHYWGDGAMWIIEEFITASPPATMYGIYYHKQFIKDTIINGQLYHRLKEAYNANLYGMVCNAIIYPPTFMLRRDSLSFVIDEQGNLYFDFSPVQKNDSTTYIHNCLYYSSSPLMKHKVDSIWYESNGSRNLKLLRITPTPYPWMKYTLWIEGIGSADGGFMPFGYHDWLVNNWYCGRCFSYNDTIYYLNLPPYSRSVDSIWHFQGGGGLMCDNIGTLVKIKGRCDTLSVFKGKILGVDIVRTNDMVKVYPQPFSDEIYVELPYEKEVRIHIYDIGGILVKECLLTDTKLPISLKDLPSGFYFMEIQLNNEMVFRKKIIKL